MRSLVAPGTACDSHREAARRIACDAALTRIVLNATSMVLDVGSDTRNWTAAQYKAAETTFGGGGIIRMDHPQRRIAHPWVQPMCHCQSAASRIGWLGWVVARGLM